MEQSPPLGPRPRVLLRGGPVAFRISPFEGVTLLAFLAVAMFGGYTAYARLTDLNAPVPAPPTYIPAFRTTLTSTVSATGTVQASQQVTLTFGSTGKIKEFLASLGDEVEAGQALARIDDTQLQQALQSAQASSRSAQARLDAATEGPDASEIAAAQQSLASARTQVTTAQNSLDTVLAKPTLSEVSTAQQAVLTAQNALATAQKNLDALLAQPDPTAVSAAQAAVAQAQTALTTAQGNRDNAETEYQTAVQVQNSAYANLQNQNNSLQPKYNAMSPACKAQAQVSSPSAIMPANGQTAQPAGIPSPAGGCITSDATTVAYSTAVTAAQTGYNAAALSYNSAVSGANQKSAARSTAAATVTSAQANLDSANKKLADAQKGPSQTDVDNARRALESAQIGLANAQQKLSDTLAGAKASEVEAARNSLESAKASLTSAQAKYDALFEPPKPDVYLPLVASVEQAQTAVETAKKNLADATIVAPFAGRISQRSGEVGSQVAASVAVFILLNPRLVRINANVDQADVSNLRVGQTASVTFDALTGRTYAATVTAIGLTPTIQQGVVTYVVDLAMDTSRLGPDAPVPAPGMTASLTITTSRTENALVVPVRAIRTVGRTRTVTVRAADGSQETRQVVAGATNGTLTQIATGLQDGEEVLVSAGSTTATTTTTQRPGTQQRVPGGGAFPRP